MSAAPQLIDLDFEGFFLCRLATDPDPGLEERGISGFTYAVAGESLLNPAIFCQPEDVLKVYGLKSPDYNDRDPKARKSQFDTMNIREASPDYLLYNKQGVGINITAARVNGEEDKLLEKKLEGARVRFASDGFPGWKFPGPMFEGRNQIVSDGDPDRFTVNPFIFRISDKKDGATLLQRFDPMDFDHPYDVPWQIDGSILARRLPVQRFPRSAVLLQSLGIADPIQHFVLRLNWLAAKVLEAEACGKLALAEAYRSRLYAVNFFTQSTGPTVLSNRLASRIPLRQLYVHQIRGTPKMKAVPIVVNHKAFSSKTTGPITIRTDIPWDIEYYIGGFDGDLLSGWITGTITLPYKKATL